MACVGARGGSGKIMTAIMMRKSRIKCPACQEFQEIDIPESIFEKSTQSGIVTVSFKTDCGHTCQAFVDRNFKIRGEACADVSLDELKDGMETPEMVQISDIVIKLASEIIRINVQFHNVINRIGAQTTVDALERALLLCQISKANYYLTNLYTQVNDVGEMDFAVQIRKEIMWINKLVKSKNSFNWASIEMRSMPEMLAQEYAHMKGVQYERLRQIFAALEFEAIEHESSRNVVDVKKIRLADLMDNMK